MRAYELGKTGVWVLSRRQMRRPAFSHLIDGPCPHVGHQHGIHYVVVLTHNESIEELFVDEINLVGDSSSVSMRGNYSVMENGQRSVRKPLRVPIQAFSVHHNAQDEF